MHLITHTKPRAWARRAKHQSPYHDTMVDHDKNVGTMLDLLDKLGLADDTIVIYSTDNGPHMNTLAGCGHDAVPQREEHELGRRVPHPEMIRWPGHIPAGEVSNEIIQHHDWLPTLLAAAATRRAWIA
jgi:arylsulfatase